MPIEEECSVYCNYEAVVENNRVQTQFHLLSLLWEAVAAGQVLIIYKTWGTNDAN